MREFDALQGYPEPQKKRSVSANTRTIENRIVASYRGRDFYDGSRDNGYGGMVNDGRWIPVAKNMIDFYGLNDQSSVLQIGCDKGYLLEAFKYHLPGIRIAGLEISEYAIDCIHPEIKEHVKKGKFTEIPFGDKSFDLIIAIGPVYSLNLSDAISCLKAIERVGKGKSFITLGAYEAENDFRLFRYWTLLGCTILSKDEWIKVLNHVSYSGDYKFNTAISLCLEEQKDER